MNTLGIKGPTEDGICLLLFRHRPVPHLAEGVKNVLFGFKKKKDIMTVDYDPAEQKPVIRCSICTGEQTACLRNLHNGKLTEIMLIKESTDLEAFQAACGVSEIERVY